jgi:hypothetical protein
MMSPTCFEPEGSSSGRRSYIQVWYILCLTVHHGYNNIDNQLDATVMVY